MLLVLRSTSTNSATSVTTNTARYGGWAGGDHTMGGGGGRGNTGHRNIYIFSKSFYVFHILFNYFYYLLFQKIIIFIINNFYILSISIFLYFIIFIFIYLYHLYLLLYIFFIITICIFIFIIFILYYHDPSSFIIFVLYYHYPLSSSSFIIFILHHPHPVSSSYSSSSSFLIKFMFILNHYHP